MDAFELEVEADIVAMQNKVQKLENKLMKMWSEISKYLIEFGE